MKKQDKKWLLQELVNPFQEIIIPEKFQKLPIEGIALDSRKVKTGFLFAAFKGTKTDGKEFIKSAIENGATVILCDENTNFTAADDICIIQHKDPRKLFSLIASRFYDNQPEIIAAVTGTNGKTSTVHFIRQIWSYLGKHSASIGTIGIFDKEDKFEYDRSNFLTTPDTVKLREIIAALTEKGVTNLAMEASSHGLDQYRLDGINVKIAAFTNLSRDHLDYHGNFANYLKAKERLFDEVMTDGIAVLNADTDQFNELEAICKKRGHKVFSYGKFEKGKKRDIEIFKISKTSEGQQISFEILGKVYNVNTSLIGEFQAYNLLCALGVVLASGPNVDDAVEALQGVTCVPGRMERVTEKDKEFSIFVDYSHTPDALEKSLEVLRPHTKGKLYVIFGCGGDRDKGKRPQMGEVADRLADHVVVTDDNPRSETPATIRAEILAAIKGDFEEIGDRRKAVHQTIAKLQKGDVLLIAGKGHEKTQTIGDEVLPFDDVEVVKEVL